MSSDSILRNYNATASMTPPLYPGKGSSGVIGATGTSGSGGAGGAGSILSYGQIKSLTDKLQALSDDAINEALKLEVTEDEKLNEAADKIINIAKKFGV